MAQPATRDRDVWRGHYSPAFWNGGQRGHRYPYIWSVCGPVVFAHLQCGLEPRNLDGANLGSCWCRQHAGRFRQRELSLPYAWQSVLSVACLVFPFSLLWPTLLTCNGRVTATHNSIISNFMAYQDRIETNLLQPFAHPQSSERFSIISVIIFKVNIVAEHVNAKGMTVIVRF